MLLPLTVSLVVAAQAIALDAPRGQRLHNAQSVNLWKRTQARSSVSTTTSSASLSFSTHDSGVKVQDGKNGLDVYAGQVAFDSEKRELVGKRATFPQYNFTQPLDHFYGSTNGTFPQRYWVRLALPIFLLPPTSELTIHNAVQVSTRHYTPGSNATVPVIVLDGGETSGEDRLPYLDTGIVDILAEATGGVGVVLEHRYYGALASSLSS